MEEKHIIAIEIGSSKIKGAIGLIDQSNTISIKTVEEVQVSDIVRYGCVLNIVETAAIVRDIVKRLEARVAPRRIEGVYVSVGGRSLQSDMTEIDRRFAGECEITREILDQILQDAIGRTLPDREIVGATQLETRVNNMLTTHAEGMYGSQVMMRLNLLSVRSKLMNNLSMVIRDRLGLRIEDFIVRPVAEADLVLTDEEKRLGCMLVDFGAETTTVAIYRHGGLQYLATIPLGSRHITRDICALNHLEEHAEAIKMARGSALEPAAFDSYSAARQDNADINNYVSARAGEIIANIKEQIRYAGLEPANLSCGIVVVGKGARLNGFIQRLQQMTGMPVRMGDPGGSVRILDGRVQAMDSIDVISIIRRVARSGAAKDCLSPVEQPRVVAQPQPVQPVQPVYQQPQPAQKPAQPVQPAQPAQPAQQPVEEKEHYHEEEPAHKSGFWPSLFGEGKKKPTQNQFIKRFTEIKDGIVNIMTEKEEIEDDFSSNK